MTSFYTRQNQQIVRDYIAAGGIWPATKAEIAEWALAHKLWQPSREDIVRLCGEALTGAMAEEVFTDEKGRTVRAKIAARTERDGTRGTFWHDLREAPIAFVHSGVTQRRNAIAAEVFHLSNVVAYSNEHHDEQIELELDFTRDVRELGQGIKVRAATTVPFATEQSQPPVPLHPGLADSEEQPEPSRPSSPRVSRALLPRGSSRRRRVAADEAPRP